MIWMLKRMKEEIPGRVRNHETKCGRNKTRTEVHMKKNRDFKYQNIFNDEIKKTQQMRYSLD